MKTMVALSGGMDSLWALWRVAAETDDELHAHHARLCDWPPRALSEEHAARHAVRWISAAFRPVRLTISQAFYAGSTRLLRTPTGAVYFAAAHAVMASFGSADRIVTGRNRDDDETEVLEPLHRAPRRAPRYPTQAGRQALIDLVFESATDRPRYERLEPWPSRREMCERLPGPLLDLAASCRSPSLIDGVWTPCGYNGPTPIPITDERQCRKCRLLAPYLPRFRGMTKGDDNRGANV